MNISVTVNILKTIKTYNGTTKSCFYSSFQLLSNCNSLPLFCPCSFAFFYRYLHWSMDFCCVLKSLREDLFVHPSVCYASWRIAFLGCFWPRWCLATNQTIDTRSSVMSIIKAVSLSVHASLHVSHAFSAKFAWRSDGQDALLPGRAYYTHMFD